MATPYDIGFASGCDERQPVVILLDTSGSMGSPQASPRIDEVNSALTGLRDAVHAHARLRARIELCLIAFNTRVEVYDPGTAAMVPAGSVPADELFVPVDRFAPPPLRADGYTCLVPAADVALQLAEERQRTLRARHVPVRRPLIWLLTDGAPSDERGRRLSAAELAPLTERLRRTEAAAAPEGCVFEAIGVSGADEDMLRVLAPHGTRMLETLGFPDILQFMMLSSERVDSGADSDQTHRSIDQQARIRAEREAFARMEEELR